MVNIYQYIERAILVDREYKLDRQYVVRDGEIVIVDEFTGRLAEGRKWRDGIHQAVEAKQGVEVTVATGPGGADHRPGLLPPLREPGRHDRHGDGLGRASCGGSIAATCCPFPPTGRPSASGCRTQVFGTADAKWEAVVEEVCQLARRRAGRC